jgi:SSS family solute:Na+ symporter
MVFVDWVIVAVLLTAMTAFSFSTFRYVKGVAGFLSANRAGGRYLLTIAAGMSGIGAISVVGQMEMYSEAGFPPVWWQMLRQPITILIFILGWIFYRFRETRCMTMAQFFEVRYSRRFRVYAGIIVWLSGIVNFGIFPAVASRFFVYYCDLPNELLIAGMTIPTYIPIMLVTLGLALAYTSLGGQVTVMVTDCAQGILSTLVIFVICLYLLNSFSWTQIESVLYAAPENASLFDPYSTSEIPDFNIWFFLIEIFGIFYMYMAWQGSQGYFSSAANPHEQKMGALIATWRQVPVVAFVALISMSAIVFLQHDDFSGPARGAFETLKTIDNETIRTQMTVPVALANILPAGLRGLFCAMMLFFLITTQDTYLHSWGSIFIQDVVLPFRKNPLSPKTHVFLLRLSIAFVALFAFLFSALFKQTEYVRMFFAITGAIISGMGAAIIGGLYWSRGTTSAAWTAMTLGWILAGGRIVLQQISARFDNIPVRGVFLRLMDFLNNTNSQVIYFYIMLSCISSYVIVSLLTNKKPVNMDRILHRGKWQVKGDHIKVVEKRSLWWRIAGVDEEFTKREKWFASITIGFSLAWLSLFILGTVASMFYDIPETTWSAFWQGWLWFSAILIGAVVAVWLTLGGIRDISRLFKTLKEVKVDESDDGYITQDEEPLNESLEG